MTANRLTEFLALKKPVSARPLIALDQVKHSVFAADEVVKTENVTASATSAVAVIAPADRAPSTTTNEPVAIKPIQRKADLPLVVKIAKRDVRVQVYVQSDVMERLESIANRFDVSISQAVNAIVKHHLATEE